MVNDKFKYFVDKDSDDKAGILLNRASSFFNTMEANAYLDKLVRMWEFYHGVYNSGYESNHQIAFTGEQGELVQVPVNHFRNIAQHIYVMITSNRPAMEARAVNTDYKSLSQTYLANSILDYYMREKRLEHYLKKATEMAIVLGSGYIKMEWNATAGRKSTVSQQDEQGYDLDDEETEDLYDGEIEFSNLDPFNVVVDGTKETWDDMDWVLTRTWKNRYDLMAKYPEMAERIQEIPDKNVADTYRLTMWSNDQTDDIPVYEFFHKRTEAVPQGNYMLFLSSDVVLMDRPLPYREIPIFRIAPGEILGTPYGYTPMFDIYPIQESINSLYSTIMTNQNAFGVQNIWVKRGDELSLETYDGGLNLLVTDEKPQSLNLTETPKEIFEMLKTMVQSAETISGVSSVARGNPQSSLESGTALALVQSMSLQFMSGLQQSYVQLIEDVGTALINILKDFVKTPKLIQLVGKNNRPYLKEFVGEDIDAISRVIVDVGNPLSRCLAKDTPVLMHDGRIKNVQDINIGEHVMGHDSLPRTVKNVSSGQEMMYRVTSKDPKRRVNYTCNESHILTLKYCSDDKRYNAKKGDILDISVKDFVNLTERQKRLLQGFKVGVEYEKKDVAIPPYILGAWLGDGNRTQTRITSMDKEIVDAWYDYAKELGLQVKVYDDKNSKAKTYSITSGKQNGSSKRNPFMSHLRGYELIGNKHIPVNYLINNKETRLELLAGLIDTDGTKIDETFVITQKDEQLSKDIIKLSESCGFRTTYVKRPSSKSDLCPNAEGEVFAITIGGDTHRIPTKLPRKQASQKVKARDWLNYGIKVEQLEVGEFFGFTLKEEPHFLLGDYTVTHNTTAGRVQMAEQLLQMKILKTPEQYYQVLNTGRLDSTFKGEMGELLLIQQENERLMEGQSVIATALDQHRLHILEHRSVINDPDLRLNNPQLITSVQEHIQKHLDFLRDTDPALLELLGEQPLGPVGGSPANQPDPAQMAPPMGSVGEYTEGLMGAPELGAQQQGEQILSENQGKIVPQVPSPPPPFDKLPTNPGE